MMDHKRLHIRRIARLLLFLTLLLVASGCTGDIGLGSALEIQDSYELTSGEQISGDRLIIANRVTLATGSSLDGTVTVIGDDVRMAGRILGDATVISESLQVSETAAISGDLRYCSSDAEIPTGVVRGSLVQDCDKGDVTLGSVVESGFDGWRDSLLVRGVTSLGSALLFGGFAALLTLVFPAPMSRISRSIRRSPLAVGLVGGMTILTAIGLTIIYVLSLVLLLPLALLPLVLLAWVALGVITLLGWAAIAEQFGRLVMVRLGFDQLPRMVDAAAGGIILGIILRIWSLFWFTGWIGWILSFVIGSVALGGVVLTRLGRKLYPSPPMLEAGG